MAESNRSLQSTNDKLVLLRKEQEQYGEGTANWAYVQEKINQIIAQNLLEYVNR